MKNFNFLTFILILLIGNVACSGLGSGESSSESDLNRSNSDQTDVEAAYTAAVEALTDSTSSTDADTTNLVSRFQCANPSTQVTEDCTCDDDVGTQSCVITFEDCELSSTILGTVYLNGSFTREINNMQEGACDESDPGVIDLKIALQGRDGEKMSATYTVDELVRTHDARFSEREITATLSPATRMVIYEVVASRDDGSPEEVLATINRHWTLLTTDQNDTELHHLEIDVSTESLSITEGNIEVSEATHRLFIDEDGMIEKRTIESGNLVARHYLAGKAFIFGVGDEGLTFDLSTACRIDEGTLTVQAYTMDDDGNLLELYATGTLTFDGSTVDADFDGDDISDNVYERGCF